ncbi:Ldh family oxidoreductase [Aureimonas phyllosphaerae]|uniref:LDH2 family malate/lactate/ureidoglycolate dehydrogenase n=1 Tax=Aureimonas phyllosphaerae TaxID=1166078 RepID=A0A7W6BWB4_9HYPH|nr:Ldh family oxidoreductase [Aureimonas phyllosphaerae]MBB3934916.1 LDH2 family malate/lactate/ureidoglycolate dehydrogenase [Aureimonas phyllosphaerae]MBB3958924.1 LDH2 family malate/lactate/ureidoglycolate dehydrogenase [Aureimonas phyllosphaerae]SFF40699.1 Malate/lactate/ureidoglycolate dehydrogenase, LDH2 family [Aureimonas phyllosphaerae]
MTSAILVDATQLEASVRAALRNAGASDESVDATTRALMHASRVGVDSHGVRLVPHYCKVMAGGRVNPRPNVTVKRTAAATGTVDGDNGPGHLTSYRAAAFAVELAREGGIGAVGAVRSSHLGAAGAYAVAIADAGMIGFATTNTDSVVGLFDGTKAFHGTNPLAFAAPVAGEKPWLLDMATSSIPMNRVLLYRSLAQTLPEGVAADTSGHATRDPHAAEMLLPLGGEGYGFKGAALAGVATLFTGILNGTTLDHEFIPMVGDVDVSTPRNMGHFFLAIDPERFAGAALFADGMRRYLDALRSVPPVEGGRVMAPGDREWDVETRRAAEGIPVDPDTARFLGLSDPA